MTNKNILDSSKTISQLINRYTCVKNITISHINHVVQKIQEILLGTAAILEGTFNKYPNHSVLCVAII